MGNVRRAKHHGASFLYSVLTFLYESSKSIALRDVTIQPPLEFLSLPRQAHLPIVIVIIRFILSALSALLIVVDAEEDCLKPLNPQLQRDLWGDLWRVMGDEGGDVWERKRAFGSPRKMLSSVVADVKVFRKFPTSFSSHLERPMTKT